VLGFDIEWRPQFRAGGKQNRTALLQLAAEDSVLCLQLAHMRSVPRKLTKLLADPRWVKCGVGILEDCVKLGRDWKGTEVRGRVDVGEVYLQHVGATDGHSTACGIKALAAVLLDEEISKPKKVSMSNWENRPLTGPQLRYAALDAWVGYAAYVELARRGSQSKLTAARRDGSTEEEKEQADKQRAIRREAKHREKARKDRERAQQGKRDRSAAAATNSKQQQQQQQQQRGPTKKTRRVSPAESSSKPPMTAKPSKSKAAAGKGKRPAAEVTVGSPNSRMVITLQQSKASISKPKPGKGAGAGDSSGQTKAVRSLAKGTKKKKKKTKKNRPASASGGAE
jgi:hypothetical protein